MKVELSRKDVLHNLWFLAGQLRARGDYIAAVSIEVARAALKRVPELDRIVYVSPTNEYIEATIIPEPKVPETKEDFK